MEDVEPAALRGRNEIGNTGALELVLRDQGSPICSWARFFFTRLRRSMRCHPILAMGLGVGGDGLRRIASHERGLSTMCPHESLTVFC